MDASTANPEFTGAGWQTAINDIVDLCSAVCTRPDPSVPNRTVQALGRIPLSLLELLCRHHDNGPFTHALFNRDRLVRELFYRSQLVRLADGTECVLYDHPCLVEVVSLDPVDAACRLPVYTLVGASTCIRPRAIRFDGVCVLPPSAGARPVKLFLVELWTLRARSRPKEGCVVASTAMDQLCQSFGECALDEGRRVLGCSLGSVVGAVVKCWAQQQQWATTRTLVLRACREVKAVCRASGWTAGDVVQDGQWRAQKDHLPAGMREHAADLDAQLRVAVPAKLALLALLWLVDAPPRHLVDQFRRELDRWVAATSIPTEAEQLHFLVQQAQPIGAVAPPRKAPPSHVVEQVGTLRQVLAALEEAEQRSFMSCMFLTHADGPMKESLPRDGSSSDSMLRCRELVAITDCVVAQATVWCPATPETQLLQHQTRVGDARARWQARVALYERTMVGSGTRTIGPTPAHCSRITINARVTATLNVLRTDPTLPKLAGSLGPLSSAPPPSPAVAEYLLRRLQRHLAELTTCGTAHASTSITFDCKPLVDAICHELAQQIPAGPVGPRWRPSPMQVRHYVMQMLMLSVLTLQVETLATKSAPIEISFPVRPGATKTVVTHVTMDRQAARRLMGVLVTQTFERMVRDVESVKGGQCAHEWLVGPLLYHAAQWHTSGPQAHAPIVEWYMVRSALARRRWRVTNGAVTIPLRLARSTRLRVATVAPQSQTPLTASDGKRARLH